MCNLYRLSKGQAEIIALAKAMRDRAGNLPELPGIYPDYAAPIIRTAEDGVRELALARWGMPSPQFALEGRKTDPGVTNIRNTKSPHWRRWLTPEQRCLVPFDAFSEFNKVMGGNIWFSLGPERPLAFFAGIWVPQWRSVRKVKEGEVSADLFGFLTTEPNEVVAPVHPKAMPVILTDPAEIEVWMRAPWTEAANLQRPLDGAMLRRFDGSSRSNNEN